MKTLLLMIMLTIGIVSIAKGQVTVPPEDQYEFINDESGRQISSPILFKELDLTSYELLSTNILFTDKDEVQKIVVAPFRIFRLTSNDWVNQLLSGIRFNLTNKSGNMTGGAALGGDNSSPYSKRSVKLFRSAFNGLPAQRPGESDADYKSRIHLDDLLLDYDEKRARKVFKWSIGTNVQLFSVLHSNIEGNTVDSTNYYALKSHSYGANASFSDLLPNLSYALSVSYNYIRKRNSAKITEEIQPYHGISASASIRIYKFLSTSQLKYSAAYRKSLFVPAIYAGMSYEQQICAGDLNFAEDGFKSQTAYTPFIDVCLKPEAQFRIGFPILNNEKATIENNTVSLGAIIQYNLKISNLSN